MAGHLHGAKPLPEPMITYCQLHLKEQISVKFKSKYNGFHLFHFQNGGYFVLVSMW